MSTLNPRSESTHLRHDLAALQGNWLWFVILGISLVVLGMIAMSWVPLVTISVVIALGVFLLLGGFAEVFGSFWCREWSGFFLHLLSGILSAVVGVLFLRLPLDATLALTMMVAVFLMVGGIFKITAALNFRFGPWVWALASGVIDVILGFLIWQQWPSDSLWVIGLFVGINMVFRGFNWIALGLAFRSLPGRSQ